MADNVDRSYLRLPSGRTLTLPLHWDETEISFTGNQVESPDGLAVALYDESTRTGAVWQKHPFPHWTFTQPCLRGDFFNRLVPVCFEYAASLLPDETYLADLAKAKAGCG